MVFPPPGGGGGSTIPLKCPLSGRLVSFNEPLITDLRATSFPGSLLIERGLTLSRSVGMGRREPWERG